MNVTITNPFDSTQTIDLTAHGENTRYGFRHLASTDDGVTAKACYYNRTWESYCYKTVLHSLIWKWIEAAGGLNPKTKRDKDRFKELYSKATAELDRKCAGWL